MWRREGKTTLVDGLLRQSTNGAQMEQNDRVMDSNALEKERGSVEVHVGLV